MRLVVDYPIVLRNAVPPRSTVAKTVIVRDSVVIDVPEYSASEAPIVMRQIIREEGQPDKAWNYRAINGELYTTATQPTIVAGLVEYAFGFNNTEIMSPALHLDTHNRAIEAVAKICRDGKSFAKANLYPEDIFLNYERSSAFRLSSQSRAQPARLPMLDTVNFVRFDRGDVEKARAEFLESARRVAIVDGRFVIRKSEPMYFADADPELDHPTVTVVRNDNWREKMEEGDLKPWQGYFAADDFDGAMEYAAEMWRRRIGDDNDYEAVCTESRIEVLDDSYVRFDGEARAAFVAGNAIVGNFVKSLQAGSRYASQDQLTRNLGEIEVETFSAFKRLTTAMKSFDDGATEQAEEIVSAARECLSSIDGQRFLSQTDFPLIDLALGRCEKRNLKREFGLNF